jgi:anti-sigma-K factor RskA
MRDLDQSSKPAADTERDVQGKPRTLEKKAAAISTSAEPWFSGSGLKRRMSMRRLFSSHSDSGQDSDLDEDGTQSTSNNWRSRAGVAALAAAVLLAVLGIGAVVSRWATAAAGPPAAAWTSTQHMCLLWHLSSNQHHDQLLLHITCCTAESVPLLCDSSRTNARFFSLASTRIPCLQWRRHLQQLLCGRDQPVPA